MRSMPAPSRAMNADGRTGRRAEQMFDSEQIAGAFFAHRRGEQDRSPRFYARPDERLADRDERS